MLIKRKSAFALDARVQFLLNTRMAQNSPNARPSSNFSVALTSEILLAANRVKDACNAFDLDLARELHLNSVQLHTKHIGLDITEHDRPMLKYFATENPEVLVQLIETVRINIDAIVKHAEGAAVMWNYIWSGDPQPLEVENIEKSFGQIVQKYEKAVRLLADILEKSRGEFWDDVATNIIKLFSIFNEIDILKNTPWLVMAEMTHSETQKTRLLEKYANHRTGQYFTILHSFGLGQVVNNGVFGLCQRITNNAGAGEFLVSEAELCLMRIWQRDFTNDPIMCLPPVKEGKNPAFWNILHNELWKVLQAQIHFLRLLFPEQADKSPVHDSIAPEPTAKQQATQPEIDEQRAVNEELKRTIVLFKEVWATASKEMNVSNSEMRDNIKEIRVENCVTRDSTAQVRAVTEEFKEAAAPFREIYKDERLCKAKADALRAAVPDLVVDAIVSEQHMSRFPTIGRLIKCLESSGGMKKLENAGHGTSRATIGRWLGIVRNIMVKYGFVQKYRVRSAGLPSRPSDRVKSPAEAEDNPPEEEETGPTNRPEGPDELD